MSNTKLINSLLDVLENNIIPLTTAGVRTGNKIFGAAILRKDNLELVVAGTNQETINPLYHGEVSCINNYWALPEDQRPAPKDCIFFSTHEPCSMCLSSITWSGFDNFYYFFNYQDSRDKFQIPHDLNILKEVFKVEDGNYQAENFYFKSYDLLELIQKSKSKDSSEWGSRVAKIRSEYRQLSDIYQGTKSQQSIPLG